MKGKCVFLILAAAAMAGFIISACSSGGTPASPEEPSGEQIVDANGNPLTLSGSLYSLTSEPGSIASAAAGFKFGDIQNGKLSLLNTEPTGKTTACLKLAGTGVSFATAAQTYNAGQTLYLVSANDTTTFHKLERRNSTDTNEKVAYVYFVGSASVASSGIIAERQVPSSGWDVKISVDAKGWQAISCVIVACGSNKYYSTHRLVSASGGGTHKWTFIN